MKIRLVQEEDFNELHRWWVAANEPPPPSWQDVPRDTFVLENEHGVPWVSLSLVGLHKPTFAWSMGLVSNPDLKEHRKSAVKELWDYVASKAKRDGYERLFCIAPNAQLEKRYEEIGFKSTMKDVTLMIKDL